MKVLDLQCAEHHVFEGWFASEDDFVSQLSRGLVACPVCGDSVVTKRLSAPRLNLGGSRDPSDSRSYSQTQAVVPGSDAFTHEARQTAWLMATRRLLASTDDVGDKFAEEARKIHYGETKERGIRGQATREETESLLDEGISVMPLALPDALKGQLQ
jgi:hypothetical protein